MAGEDQIQGNEQEQLNQDPDPDLDLKPSSPSSSDDSDTDSYASDSDSDAPTPGAGEGGGEGAETEDSPEANFRLFSKVLDSKSFQRRLDEEDEEYEYYEDQFDFPQDPENWREEDLRELWADAPLESTKPGWDPVWADDEDWDIVHDELREGRDPPHAPFYIPYRKPFPAIPDNHFDITSPKSVIEELDRIEEFLKWVSYVFPDGSTYEGTVWDDLAHGKGVYVAEQGLVRYEGEWLQNNMEGHGVVEVDIPDVEPIPGSKLEATMRAEGKIISRDFLPPEDKNWLEMDIQDSVLLSGGRYEIPFYENDEWIRQFGMKPEKGRYRYAGQWKHGRMHGCGVYEYNERLLYGRFYFGQLLDDSSGCDADVSTMHAGIAEVAAAKARMFVNKPDGMVIEERGPYNDPQHPYFYEEEDAWQAPGFVNQFYEVPDYWKTYVREVDQEREMWLNSFYKAPLRLPMPAELEYWWENYEEPEFVLINQEPEPDPDDPSKPVYTEDPLILHTPTGRLINYVEDEEHGIRLFWQPPLKEGEDVDSDKAVFLPLGYDEFFGQTAPGEQKEGKMKQWIAGVETKLKSFFEKLENWTEEKKKESEMRLKVIEKELELADAELCLEELLEDMEMELKMKQKEEEKKAAMGQVDREDASGSDQENGPDSDEEEEEDSASFGSVIGEKEEKDLRIDDRKGKNSGKSPFAAASLLLSSSSLTSLVPSNLWKSFLSWNKGRECCASARHPETVYSVYFHRGVGEHATLRAIQEQQRFPRRNGKPSPLHSLAQILAGHEAPPKLKKSLNKERSKSRFSVAHVEPIKHDLNFLSMHVPIDHFGTSIGTFT